MIIATAIVSIITIILVHSYTIISLLSRFDFLVFIARLLQFCEASTAGSLSLNQPHLFLSPKP